MNVFDIIGPAIIGPSSSHTAGACKIGNYARYILNEEPKDIYIRLSGSFSKTGKGHGTNLALLGGILGLNVDDENIKNSENIAKNNKIKYKIEYKDIKDAHPNTAYIKLIGKSNKKLIIIGESIGGGNIRLSMLNNIKVNITGKYDTLIIPHDDEVGVIYHITEILYKYKINIEKMFLSDQNNIEQVVVLETKGNVTKECIDELQKVDNIHECIFLKSFAK